MFLNPEWLMQQGEDAMLLHQVHSAYSDHPSHIAVAVSGGGDSVALLHLAYRVATQTGQTLSAVTVDHGLRAESAAEAATVAQFCQTLNIPHTTLHWNGTEAQGNLMAAARDARYQLIGDWAKSNGIGHVMLGHTRDDEAETFLMQLGRGAGVDGLSAMDWRPHRLGIHWGRPLHQSMRSELRDYLTRQGIEWIDDPTNENPKYLRSRIRAAMPQLADLGLTVDAIATSAFNQKMARAALDHYAAKEADTHLTIQNGDVILPRDLDHLMVPQDIQRRLWLAAVMWIGGGDHAPRQSGLSQITHAIRDGRDVTLNGCAILVKRDHIRFTRELNAVRDLRCSTTEIWDGRWQLTGPHAPDLHISAVGEEGIRLCSDWRASGFPRPSIISSPAVWRSNTIIAAPLAGFGTEWTAQIVAPFSMGKNVH
ncbi:tRNA lysidine(34) synthetase TilS [Aestuarium zhoushanense]|nr:tRNA lysidine(34) synthetase TilS [Aestuarium zhoushanense]